MAPCVRSTLPLLLFVTSTCYQPITGPADGAFNTSTHEAFFPIVSGAHGGADCNACHGAYDTFTRFSCITCHEHSQTLIDPAHAGVAGYSYSEQSCYDCHPTGEGMSRAAHTWFPINGGNHGSVGCGECHPQNHQSVACFDCHAHTCAATTPRHGDVRNFSCDSMRCYNCHPTGQGGGD